MSLLFVQLRGELTKLFARKRTYLGFGAFLVVEAAILLLINLHGSKAFFRRLIEQNGYAFEQYFSGVTLGFIILTNTTFLLGALYLALVAGDVVSKEVEDGTMRMMLCRPASRARILLLKYVSCIIYTFALTFFIGLSALVAGLIYGGMGGLFVFAPMDKVFALYEPAAGLLRYLACLPFLALSLTTVTSLGFLFSCLNMKPAAATIVTLSIFFLDFVLRNIPYFESLKPYFLTARMSVWIHAMEIYVPWWRIAEDFSYLFAADATFVILALALFHERDFKA